MRSTILFSALFLSACAGGPVGNNDVPDPAKPVETSRYLGKWFEVGRYENSFEKGCEGVTAEYAALPDGEVSVKNTCRQGAVDGEVKVSEGRAKIVDETTNAKLKVSFFGPFYLGDYWVLDRADDYSWSIVGEPSGKFLWLLSRSAKPGDAAIRQLAQRAASLGYDTALIRWTKHLRSGGEPCFCVKPGCI